ncbi:MAG TPA: glycerophosphodiester phosphodiesterase family protein, partial [Chloroflexia bacterium]|nr:glycerophosphodiester phosphodiesterase family protein [Chloroflexia bacterium]
MVLLAANGGNRLHAPANGRVALVSAYTCGADVLEFGVQLTSDGQVVVATDESVEGMTGTPGKVAGLKQAELKALDFGATFTVRGSTALPWKKDPPEAKIESLGGLLDQLPPGVVKVIEVVSNPATAEDLAGKTVKTLRGRGALSTTVLCSRRPEVLRAAATLAPELSTGLVVEADGGETDIERWLETGPGLLVVQLGQVLGQDGQPTRLAAALRGRQEQGALSRGVIVRQPSGDGTFSKEQVQALSAMSLVYAISTASALDTGPLVRQYRALQDSSFEGKVEEPGRIHFGYAKANRYAHIFQDDGVHVDIKPYDRPATFPPTDDPVQKQLNRLQEGEWS